jgi:hypothetical protein
MAEMWACSDLTRRDPRFIIGKEFAKTYWVDRDNNLQRIPPDAAFFTSTADGEAITTNVQCGNLAGSALGTAHSHPEDSGDGPNPSTKDRALAQSRRCGTQHFIISKDAVTMYFPDGTPPRPLGTRASVLGPEVPCNQSIPGDQEVI